MSSRWLSIALLASALALAACGGEEAPLAPAGDATVAAIPSPAPATAADLPRGLLLALSTFRSGEDGKQVPQSELVAVIRSGGAWSAQSFADPDSNVFHKALVVDLPGAGPSLITLGGMQAAIKRWQKGEAVLAPGQRHAADVALVVLRELQVLETDLQRCGHRWSSSTENADASQIELYKLLLIKRSLIALA